MREREELAPHSRGPAQIGEVTWDDLNRAQAVAHCGSWRMNVQLNVLHWSDETYRIFGIPIGAHLTYETFLAAVHPDDRARVDVAWAAALNGAPYDVEHRILAGRKIKWVRERANLEFEFQAPAARWLRHG